MGFNWIKRCNSSWMGGTQSFYWPECSCQIIEMVNHTSNSRRFMARACKYSRSRKISSNKIDFE